MAQVVDDPTARFAALVGGPPDELPLDEAVLLIAAHARPELDLDAERARLEVLAAGVRAPSVDALRDHLVDELGFAGDTDTYHDARNSLLPDVLDRRRGIPLTLAIVAIEVGRRCGVPLEGIGMPGHFLLRGADDPDRFLDLFSGGGFLGRSQCRAIFQRLHARGSWDDRFLDSVGPMAMVSRMLTNLVESYRRAGDHRGLSWAVGLRVQLPEATAHDRRELALLLGAAGRYDAAADVLDSSDDEADQHTVARLRARLN